MAATTLGAMATEILDVTNTRNGERGTGNGERGTGNGSLGTSVQRQPS